MQSPRPTNRQLIAKAVGLLLRLYHTYAGKHLRPSRSSVRFHRVHTPHWKGGRR